MFGPIDAEFKQNCKHGRSARQRRMNKDRYRVVYSRVRGAMMVVQENGSSPRTAGNSQGVSAPLNLPGLRVLWQPIAMAAALLFGVPLFSFAQIAPTPGTSTHVVRACCVLLSTSQR